MDKDDKLKKLEKESDRINVGADGNLLQELNSSIKDICNSLMHSTQKYQEVEISRTYELLKKYIRVRDRLGRGLYSEITNYLFDISVEERGIFNTNLLYLLQDSIQNPRIDNMTKEVIMRIYDHAQLASAQVDAWSKQVGAIVSQAKNGLQSDITKVVFETKTTFQTDMRNMEKEYITILGIFASIVVAFMGGATFSTSVLQNMHLVSSARLLITVDAIMFMLFNVVYLLTNFLLRINGREFRYFKIQYANYAFVAIAVIAIGAWMFSAQQIPAYLLNCLPWHK